MNQYEEILRKAEARAVEYPGKKLKAHVSNHNLWKCKNYATNSCMIVIMMTFCRLSKHPYASVFEDLFGCREKDR